MRITDVDLYLYDAPFRFGYRSSHLVRTKADSVIIAIHFDSGVTGYGESAPRPYVTGETTSTVMAFFAGAVIPLLLGGEVQSVADVEGLLERLKQACQRAGGGPYPSALGAVDIALLDALGKSFGAPLGSLLGPPLRDKIPWSIVIPMLPPSVIRKYRREIDRVTFDSIKILLDGNEGENEERVGLIRELFGEEIDLRVEANGNWTREEAHANLNRLKRFGIAAVEQPVAQGDIEGLREIRETFGIPVVVDESMYGLDHAEALISQGACDILNIKLSKVGGLLNAGRIAAYAAARGVPCLLGSHVGETFIMTNAALHFLTTAPGLILVEGFSSLLFGEALKIEDLCPQRLLARIATAPGLGFDPGKTLLSGLTPEQVAIPRA